MKIAPIMRACEPHDGVRTTLIHTGQHYDTNLSDVFFQELGIRQPDVRLSISGRSHAEQTGEILQKLEQQFQSGDSQGAPFDVVVVVGDVNSTMAATLAATKLQIPVAHVEAGLRSRDRSMPEEINRLVTDAISDLLLVSEPVAVDNLKAEGQPDERIELVGNVMIDTLRQFLPQAAELPTLEDFGVKPQSYATVTLHRPSNVDDPETLAGIVSVLVKISEQLPVIFPVHPRTQARLESFQLLDSLTSASGIQLSEPMGYLAFLRLNSQARVLITDSGGLQEEATALGIPCLTMRANTERPITVNSGTSTLIGSSAPRLQSELEDVLSGRYKVGECPELWDGKASERIVQVLINRYAHD